MVASIGNISRFSTPQKLASHFGLAPRVRQSGDRGAIHGRITKQGNVMARTMLVKAACSAATVPGPLRAFFLRIKDRTLRARQSSDAGRLRILYLKRQFACRTCSNLRYASQYESPRARMRRRLLKIRKLIGPDLVIGHPLNPPPKGMSVGRWRGLVDEYAALRELYWRECEKPRAWRTGAPTAGSWKRKVKEAAQQSGTAQ